jgi:hypothetical protein
MVMLQVDQVDALFKEIDTIKANNWKEVCLILIFLQKLKIKTILGKTGNCN